MLPTFVIGLREGLEAALIVSIIAAFLSRQGRRDLLRWVYAGVAAAVLLCLGVGAALEVLSSDLPQRQQEGLETVVGALAVGMVTYMVLWMRRHSRQLKGQLEGLAAEAMDEGGGKAGRAMVAMAFLAVLREGFETVVFLLAAFNATTNTTASASGAVLGIVVAVGLGYAIYRGGVRLNLSKFFRATGLVLVLVAAGLVVNALHTAHEAGWLNVGQGGTVNLTWLVRPGSVQASLLTGMLGIQDHPVVIEVIGWLAYLIPVGLYVAWPPGRRIARRVLARVLAGVAIAGAAAALALALTAPAGPPANPPLAAGPLSAQLVGRHDDTATVRTAPQNPADANAPAQPASDLTLQRTGTAVPDGLDTDVYTLRTTGSAPSGSNRPALLSYAQVAALNGGRLPLGVRPASGAGTATAGVQVRYLQDTTLTVSVAPATGRIVDLRWAQTVTATAIDTPVGTVALSTPITDATRALPASAVVAATATARGDAHRLATGRELRDWAWVAGVVAAAVVLGLLGLLGSVAADRRRQRAPRAVEQVVAGAAARAGLRDRIGARPAERAAEIRGAPLPVTSRDS
jgi:high-affinity iron transporter